VEIPDFLLVIMQHSNEKPSLYSISQSNQSTNKALKYNILILMKHYYFKQGLPTQHHNRIRNKSHCARACRHAFAKVFQSGQKK
jgi:hypothetical protein